jgi:hypothetical protein
MGQKKLSWCCVGKLSVVSLTYEKTEKLPHRSLLPQ